MPIATGLALGIGLGAAAISGGAAAYGAHEQANAANHALSVEQQNQQEALYQVEQEWQTQQANEAPFLKAGQGATLELSSLLNTPGQGLLSPYPGGQFTAPTLAQAEQDPGYQFALTQGEKAVQNSAAAKGELLDPNAISAQDTYAQNLATTQYGNVYNRALQTYGTNYDVWAAEQQNEYNRLLGLSGVGSTAAGQLGQEGAAYDSTIGNILVGGAAQQAQQINNAAAATASGITGVGNAFGGALSNFGSTLMLQSLLNPATSSSIMGGTFNGGSVGGVSDPGLGTPGYMPGGAGSEDLVPPSVQYPMSTIQIPA